MEAKKPHPDTGYPIIDPAKGAGGGFNISTVLFQTLWDIIGMAREAGRETTGY